ncbi:MAG: hypothetical protein WC736_15305 [Gallionella sp.]|jgi:hypothetical protein
MKKILALFVATATALTAQAQSLVPDAITLTWKRDDVSAYADTTNIYMAGVTYSLTNCQAKITTNTVQDLTGLGISIRVGDAGTNILYACTAIDATNGTFACNFKFPTWTPGPTRSVTGQEGIELTLTNATLSFTYKARKLFTVTQPLH